MKNISKLPLIIALLLTISACGGKRASNEQDQLNLGYWGQLDGLDLYAPNPIYLIHVKPSYTYKVCVASHLINEHPQFLTQVDAAIKIWGKYINRDLTTEVYSFDMEAPDASESQDDSFQKYSKACPNADVSVGYGNIGSVGLTASQEYSYLKDGMKVIQNATKVVFLQNPALAGRKWQGLYSATDADVSVEQLLTLLMSRSQTQFIVDQNSLSAMLVLMHEFGHVWGLCDMYPLGANHDQTNCDPTWSKKDQNGSIILTPHATMSLATWKNSLYLQDDDIEGIRTMAARTQYINEWNNQTNFTPVAAATEQNFYFEHRSSQINGNNLAFRIALYNTIPLTMQVNLMSDKGPLNYQPMKIDQPMDVSDYTLNLGFPAGITISKLQVVIKNDQGQELARHEQTF